MKSPVTGKEMIRKHEIRELEFRKEKFQVSYHYYLCEDTGEQFENDQLAELNINQVYNKYREKNNILFPGQIAAIKRKYRLSARKMSEILGFGTNTYSQYENGEIPGKANARLIQVAEDPEEFLKLAKLAGKLDKKLERTIEELKGPEEIQKRDQLEALFSRELPNSLNGYKMFDAQKTYQIILFFAEKMAPWKTRLNKLMFYTDFTFFKYHGRSITGLIYRAIPFGPVPKDYDMLFSLACKHGYVDQVFEEITEEVSGEKFVPMDNAVFNPEIFALEELETLESVSDRFADRTSHQIKEMSHQEKGWIENHEKRNLIDYAYGFELVYG